jgi:hypothetical protein
MQLRDVAYYRERAAAERRLAEASRNPNAAAVHEELARKYEALLAEANVRSTLSIVAASKRSA